MKRHMIAAITGGLILAAAGVSAAGNFVSSADSDFFTSGRHQFYVWCAGSADSTAVSVGANAETAQMRLYQSLKAAGRSTCWPVWQGRLGD
jgi:heme exporter protein D